MTSRLRGSAKEEPKTSAVMSKTRTHLGSDQESKDKYVFSESQNKVSRKDSTGKFDKSDGKFESNGYDVDAIAEDPDLMYRRSRDHFASWDIKDIIDEKNADDKKAKSNRKSRFDLFKSNGTDKKLPNGDVKARHKFPGVKRSESKDGKFDSIGRRHRDSRSPEMENDKRRSKHKTHEESEKIGSNSRQSERMRSPEQARMNFLYEVDGNSKDDRPRNRALLQEIENFGSLRRGGNRSPRRYDGNRSPDQENDRIRALIDRFKSNDQDDDVHMANGRKYRHHRSVTPETDAQQLGKASGFEYFGSGDVKFAKSRSPDRGFDKYRSMDDRESGKNPSLGRKSSRGRHDDKFDLENDREDGRYPSLGRKLGRGKHDDNVDDKFGTENDRENRRYPSLARKSGRGRHDGHVDEKFGSDDDREDGKYPSLGRHRSRARHDGGEDERLGSGGRKWNDEYDDRAKFNSVDRKHHQPSDPESYKSLERKYKKEDIRDSDGHGLRKRSDTYSVERSNRRKSREIEDDLNSKESSSKRRSYVHDGSPENFDVHIQRYERALLAPRRDLDLNRKSSFKDQDVAVKRRSSLKNKDHEKPEKKDRYSRPLTPPEDADAHDRQQENTEDRKKAFSSKDWYESNKQFAAKYLQENSKLRPSEGKLETEHFSAGDRQENGMRGRSISPRRETIEIRDNHRGNSTKDVKGTYFGERTRDPDESYNNGRSISPRVERVETNWHRSKRDPEVIVFKSPKDSMESDRKSSTVITFRDTSQEPLGVEKRHKRGVFVINEEATGRHRRQDGDSRRHSRDKEPKSGATPSRKIWERREGGVQITDIEEGQPCLQCGDTCPGFQPHSWRKNCTSCKCPREAHDVCHEEWVSVRARLGLKGDGGSGPIGFDPRDRGLAWAPPGLPFHKVEEYFSMLPEISVPRLGTPGERHRDRQLATQLPKQDLARAYCRHLDPQHSTSADDFMAARNEIALDIGTVQEIREGGIECGGCHEPIKFGTMVVSASKLGLFYHPACFQCAQCEELLVDLAYCVHDDTLYCERHYAEQLKPRCAACDELIFSGEYTKAMNKDWHSGHFCCWQCDESLTGQRYVLRDEHPYCIKCYESVFANGCEECSKIIGIDSKDLSYKDKHWHEACFLCNKCRVSLVDKQFGSKVDKIYCGNCYDAQFASRCDGCGEIFRAGTKKMEYKTRQWHEKCFCCVVCKNAIGTKSFIPREQEIYCAGCYEDKFATRCVKCNKIITSGGVTYKNEPWHRECFTCSNCNTSLAGQRFTSRDEKPYCADCFGELFAKRCTACTKPITGIGGTRFISFEDRHWHNDCFICAGCKTSLVGRGFITDADDIICPECAKQKLM